MLKRNGLAIVAACAALAFVSPLRADQAAAVLLADGVRQLRGTPILVVATYRGAGTAADTSAGLLPRLSADANTERVDLSGLPTHAVGDMLLAAGLPASDEQAEDVHSETGGNPFLVRELARALVEQGRGEPAPFRARPAAIRREGGRDRARHDGRGGPSLP